MMMDCAFQKAQIKKIEQLYYEEMVNVRNGKNRTICTIYEYQNITIPLCFLR